MTARFRSDIRQWTDGAALAAHLNRHDAAAKAQGVEPVARLSHVPLPVAEWYTPTEGESR